MTNLFTDALVCWCRSYRSISIKQKLVHNQLKVPLGWFKWNTLAYHSSGFTPPYLGRNKLILKKIIIMVTVTQCCLWLSNENWLQQCLCKHKYELVLITVTLVYCCFAEVLSYSTECGTKYEWTTEESFSWLFSCRRNWQATEITQQGSRTCKHHQHMSVGLLSSFP